MSENHTGSGDEQDDVARLLRLAGKRSAVAVERIRRARAAARECWREEVRRRSSRRIVWAFAGTALVATVILLSFLRVGGDAPVRRAAIETALVERLVGGATSHLPDAGGGNAPRRLTTGDSVSLGSLVSTDAEGRLALRLPTGHSLRMDASSEVRLRADGAVTLERGALYVDSRFEGGVRDRLEIHTAFGLIREIGTRYELRLENGVLFVRLREGKVSVRRQGAAYTVIAGSELALDSSGPIHRRAIDAHGDIWDWVAEATPLLELEGRTARAVLDWIARERGWTLSFADEAALRRAEEAVLGGGLGVSALDEALEVVLPTCRLAYDLRDGTLVVRTVP